MKRQSILTACCILGLSTAFAIAPAHAQQLTPITISYQPTNYWALPFYVATKKGWWKEVGLDPKFVLFPAGIPQVASAAAGSWDVGATGSVPAVFGAARFIGNDYVFFAGYVVLQFIVLAQAWNILGGYTGYVNFGSAAFFALGAYTSVFFHKSYPLPIPLLMALGGIVSGLAGLGMGYLTLRLRGAFFAIATLAFAVVLQTLVVNWNYLGGARGAYVIRPESVWLIGNYVHYLFFLMLALAVLAITTARTIERSRLGYGFATIRDDELAAEACGVPTLRLKLIATTLSGAFMGMAGAPFPYYIGYVQPAAAFGLDYAVNSIAMPMIGGTTTWVGPLVGAILVAGLQQWATVTISSELGLLVVGLLLVGFVIVAPSGIVGLVRSCFHSPSSAPRVARKPAAADAP